MQVAPRDSHNQKGYTLLGFGRDIKQYNRGEVLTSQQLNVQPVGSCTNQYNKILEDPTEDLYELVFNTLPKGFEDPLICGQIPGKAIYSELSIIPNVLFTLNHATHSSVLLLCVVPFNVNKTLRYNTVSDICSTD